MKRWFVVSVTLALLGAGAILPAAQAPELEKRLAETLVDLRMRYGFPGATVAIFLKDGTVYTAATGLADLEHDRVMTPATPMLAASIGKTFVAAAVLALESEGFLARNDLLSVHLGDRKWFEQLPNAETLTIDHLMHHTGGLKDHVHLPAFHEAWPRLAGGDDVDPEDLVGFVTGQAPLFDAGQGWAYSDTGYVLLGLVIEKVTGRPWQDIIHARFLVPLALGQTFPSDRRELPGLAIGYVAPGNPFGLAARSGDAFGRLYWNPVVEFSGGGFASTSADLARWGQSLFTGEAMGAPYRDRLLDSVPIDSGSPNVRYGAGVAIYLGTPRGRVYGHGGWIPGYVSSLRHYADHGVTVAFQINSDIGIADDTTDLVLVMEATLADLAIEARK